MTKSPLGWVPTGPDQLQPQRFYRWCAARRCYVHKTFFQKIMKIQRSYVPLCGHTTFVLLTLSRTMTIIDKITILCNDVNKNKHFRPITGNKYSTLHVIKNCQSRLMEASTCQSRMMEAYKSAITAVWQTLCSFWNTAIFLLQFCVEILMCCIV